MRRVVYVVGVMLGTAVPASAQIFDWNNISGGTFATPANWTPAGPPGTNATARFNLPNTYTVTFGGNATNGLVSINQGNVTWAVSAASPTTSPAFPTSSASAP